MSSFEGHSAKSPSPVAGHRYNRTSKTEGHSAASPLCQLCLIDSKKDGVLSPSSAWIWELYNQPGLMPPPLQYLALVLWIGWEGYTVFLIKQRRKHGNGQGMRRLGSPGVSSQSVSRIFYQNQQTKTETDRDDTHGEPRRVIPVRFRVF